MAITTRTIGRPRGTSHACGGRRKDRALRMLIDNIDADLAKRLDEVHRVTRPFASLCREADVCGTVEREGRRMPAREERAC